MTDLHIPHGFPPDKALQRGLYRRFLDGNGLVDQGTWSRARASKEVVGMCRRRRCDGLMVATPSEHDSSGRQWFTMQCLSCAGEAAVRADKPPLQRSSRREEMPPGFWARREAFLKAMYEQAKNVQADQPEAA